MDTSLKIHYHRYDENYENWMLWTWLDEVSFEIKPSDQDDFGLIFIVDIDRYPPNGNIGLLPKYKDWQSKDAPNRFWSRNMPREIWILEGRGKIFTVPPNTDPTIRKAFIDSPNEITVILSHRLNKNKLNRLLISIQFKNHFEIKPSKIILLPEGSDSSNIILCELLKPINIDLLPGKVNIEGFSPGDLYLRGILDESEYITKEKLGAFYSLKQTEFNVFAPGATELVLNLYNTSDGGEPERYYLQKRTNGLWSTIVQQDLLGKYYTYSVNGNTPAYKPNHEVIDPYAKCTTLHNGRGIITNDNTEVSEGPTFPIQDAIIYEVHVRDFTIDENSGVKLKGKYLGFAERETKIPNTDISTCIDHLVELGVNTVQLMPVQDFEHNDFSDNYFWGYMPVNFNSPDGWFATSLFDDSRVREFKKLVDELHKSGIKVVMDVVYNHTAETNPEILYNFNGLIPSYYYRQKLDGSYWNGSGCGNEVRSENPMIRRFIVESLKYWVEEYKIDGFRFDLMGLIDIETMREIVKTLRSIRPDIFIYGEPWTAGETPIQPTVKGTQRKEGFGVFNDHFRDAIKGPWYNTEPGYVQTGKNVEAIKRGIEGSINDFADSPLETINYVACHDGLTLWDRLKASTDGGTTITEKELKAMDKLCAAIILTSQGVPFIHAGQEFLRSKFGSHNSYNQPDEINKIRWKLKEQNSDIFQYYRGLIKLRTEHPIFRMTSAEEIKNNLIFLDTIGTTIPKNCIAYKLERGDSDDKWKEVLVLLNPNRKSEKFVIPKGKWNIVVNDEISGVETIQVIKGKSVKLNPISAMVLYRE